VTDEDVIARRPLAWLALATAALACGRPRSVAPPAALPESEAPLPAYAPTPPLTGGEQQLAAAAQLPNNAVVAVALLLDNKDRCVRIAAHGSELVDVSVDGTAPNQRCRTGAGRRVAGTVRARTLRAAAKNDG
jgi:hypothetical protein